MAQVCVETRSNLVVGRWFVREVDPPILFEDRFVRILARGEDLLEEKGTGFFSSFLSQVSVKADRRPISWIGSKTRWVFPGRSILSRRRRGRADVDGRRHSLL